MNNIEENIITWNNNDQSSKEKAFSQLSKSIDEYGATTKTSAYHYRNFLDIEPNKSVRPGFTAYDYYAFRPEESVPAQQKRIIKMCMDAYDKVGIVRNVIDLMGDFGCQGISIVHENKSVEDFYKQWFKKVDGKERSERFLNNLYRTGNVIIYRSSAIITPEITKYIKTVASDIRVEVPNIEKNVIPWRYNFFNPLTVDLKDGELSVFLGRKNFEIKNSKFLDNFKNGVPPNILETLPLELKRQVNSGKRSIPLDPEKLSIFYYKKDDWNFWANPMTYAILDDIIMLEKMRLADLSALDGAISNIRLWTLGNLEHQILPNKSAINKLRNILASNVGGGTMELVWGPELSYTESNSQVYKFLGSEKYQSVLNSIYAGLGVPPTLTGMANNGGGFTNNFISLKTLVERLQYGRDMLIKFWEREAEIVRKAMGFRKSPHIVFDQMSLSDESSEKQLLIQLADRDIISHETVLERFKEIPTVEKVRLQRENKERESENLPEKIGPFSVPDIKNQLPSTPEASPDNGRPPNKKDTKPRKKRVDTPKSNPGLANLFVWTQSAYEQISSCVNEAYLQTKSKSNMRQLTRSEVAELEDIKFHTLVNIKVFDELSSEKIKSAVISEKYIPDDLKKMIKFNKINTFDLNIDDYKKKILATYVEYILSKN